MIKKPLKATKMAYINIHKIITSILVSTGLLKRSKSYLGIKIRINYLIQCLMRQERDARL